MIDLVAVDTWDLSRRAGELERLDDLIPGALLDPLIDGAVELCRVGGALLAVPVTVDVKVLWLRADRVATAPTTWDDLVDSGAVYGFPARGPSLYRLFHEIASAHGGDVGAEAHARVVLRALAARAPEGASDWDDDDVATAVALGAVDAASLWPQQYDTLRHGPAYPELEVQPHLSGPEGGKASANCRGWAIGLGAVTADALAELAERCGEDAGRRAASLGLAPVHDGALRSVLPFDERDARRLELIRGTVGACMVSTPSATAEARWPEIRAAVFGEG